MLIPIIILCGSSVFKETHRQPRLQNKLFLALSTFGSCCSQNVLHETLLLPNVNKQQQQQQSKQWYKVRKCYRLNLHFGRYNTC